MILYFTGTNNSRYIAEKISKALNESIICINDKIKENDTSTILVKDRIIFVLPTYAWRIPKVVEDWIRKTEFLGSRKAWFIMNCGEDIGNAAKYNKGLCDDTLFTYMGTAKVVMPENYIAMFDVPDKEESAGIINKADLVIDKIINDLLDRKPFMDEKATFLDKMKSGPVNPLFYKLFVKASLFKTDDKCISCGKCVKCCPLNNISIKEGKPVWGKNCTHCMACICNCPAEAIEYGKKSIGKRRYLCE